MALTLRKKLISNIKSTLRAVATANYHGSSSQGFDFQNILIVRKPTTTNAEFKTLIKYFRKASTSIYNICHWHDNQLFDVGVGAQKSNPSSLKLNDIDLICCLGGDGTILFASRLFPLKVPPILSFSLGTLGFLSSFSFHDHELVLDRVLGGGQVGILDRIRLQSNFRSTSCLSSGSNVTSMNEFTIHRGLNVQLGHIDIWVNDEFLTEAVADGVIVSSPTGSTAYSLSSGGPIVHNNVKCIILTPIAPRSLSFRPIVLPIDVIIKMRLSKTARGVATVSADGRNVYSLSGDSVLEIRRSSFSIPVIVPSSSDWLRGLRTKLNWNKAFVNPFNR